MNESIALVEFIFSLKEYQDFKVNHLGLSIQLQSIDNVLQLVCLDDVIFIFFFTLFILGSVQQYEEAQLARENVA